MARDDSSNDSKPNLLDDLLDDDEGALTPNAGGLDGPSSFETPPSHDDVVRNDDTEEEDGPDPVAAVVLMDQLGVLTAVVPEGTDVDALARLVRHGAPPDALLRMAALLIGDVLAFAARLRLSAAERDRLLALRAAPLATPEDDDVALRRLLADTPACVLVDRTWLSGLAGPEWNSLRARLRTMPVPVFPMEGRDILALGLLPGPRVGALLRSVRAWWLEGGCVATVEACRDEVRRQF